MKWIMKSLEREWVRGNDTQKVKTFVVFVRDLSIYIYQFSEKIKTVNDQLSGVTGDGSVEETELVRTRTAIALSSFSSIVSVVESLQKAQAPSAAEGSEWILKSLIDLVYNICDIMMSLYQLNQASLSHQVDFIKRYLVTFRYKVKFNLRLLEIKRTSRISDLDSLRTWLQNQPPHRYELASTTYITSAKYYTKAIWDLYHSVDDLLWGRKAYY